jgi:D-alanine-D-alanine ligase
MSKQTVGVLFGGKSAEHEVSILSANSIIKNLDCSKYTVIPIYVDIHGQWNWLDSPSLESGEKKISHIKHEIQKIQGAQEIASNPTIIHNLSTSHASSKLDVIFPILHGTLGEDGAMQGLLDLLSIPYISSGILSSAITMDKEFSKKILQQHNINVAPYISIKEYEYFASNQETIFKKILDKFDFPLFVKPSNCGSSIGISKAKDSKELDNAIREAFKYDQKILVEQGITCREIEVSVLENINDYDDPIISHPGELIPNDEFYSYNAKYIMADGAKFDIPAKLPTHIAELIRKNAGEIFKILECNCLARVDFFLEDETNKVFFNEINTLPGFTEISLYPKMLEHYGIKYRELLDLLISLAIKKHKIRQNKIENSVRILDSIKLLK